MLELISKAFFKHKEKEALRVCIKAIVHCISNSQGKLKTCAQNIYFSLQDTLVRERLVYFDLTLFVIDNFRTMKINVNSFQCAAKK